MDPTLVAEFNKAKYLFDRISWPLSVVGLWPKNLTKWKIFKSILFLTYFVCHLSLQFMYLMSVMGNIELVILNLMETGFQTMAFFRIVVNRFNKLTLRILNTIEEDLSLENFRDSAEMEIFFHHTSKADHFYRMAVWASFGSASMWYIQPLELYLIARAMNDTAVLINPYQIYTFVDISPIKRTAIVYVCQMPLLFTAVLYTTCFCVMLGFVSNMCSQLAILTHRITTMKESNMDPRVVFQEHTNKHFKVFRMAQWLNDAFHLSLLYDLVVTTVLIGLIIFKFLIHVNEEFDLFALFGLGSYIFCMTALVYINCFMGEYLNEECNALLYAYYQCNWYDMSPTYKKALIICMRTTYEPIRITAGKFYVFSIESFGQIMKSSMVYVSALKTIM